MKWYLCLVALLAALPAAHADERRLLFDGCRWHFPRLAEEWRQRACWCPDDYCRKKLPCTPCNAKGCVDDYCRKKLPCTPCNAKGCVDDYCPKGCAIFLWKPFEPWYRCGRVPSCSPR
jgi:hypothetical protein